jgi:hypothetical protein
MFALDRGSITFVDYEDLRARYVSANKYLDLFSLAPRIFGETWAQSHIMDLDPRFQKPDKVFNSTYVGQYDLWIEGVRVEVKAARAIKTKVKGALASKAIHFGEDDEFWMNFQQLKPDAADVFVFVGVWVDKIIYWVLNRDEVENNPYLSHQHRGGIEFQIGVKQGNLEAFRAYEVEPCDLADIVVAKAE